MVDHTVLKPLSEDADSYYNWLNNTDPSKDPDSFFSVTFYNLTNPAEVLAGAAPVVDELPQVTWQRKRVYFNATFSDDNTEVAYNVRYYYVFDQDRSDNTTEYRVTNVWPTWLTLLNKAGGTTQHAVAAVSGQLLNALFAPLLADFGEQASAQWGNLTGIEGLQLAPGSTLANNSAFEGRVKKQSESYFEVMRAAYADKYFPEFGAWCRLSNHSFPFESSVLDPAASHELLVTGKCPLLSGTYPLQEPPELVGLPCAAALQLFASTNVSSPYAQEVFPMGTNNTLTADARRLAVADYLQTTAKSYLANLVFPGDASRPLDDALWASRAPEEWLFDYEDPLLALLKHGDTAANAFNSAFFRSVTTDAESLSTDPRRTTVRTGRGDVDRALWYDKWKGVSVLPERPGGVPTAGGDTTFWCDTNLTVAGHDDTQLPVSTTTWWSWTPGIKKGVDYPVWVPQIFNAANFTYLEGSDARGIDVWRFHLSDSSLAPQPQFSERYGGVFNLTCPQGGPPVMVTEPRYYRVDPDFPAEYRVDGVKEPVPELHDTFLDVDPVSGTTLRGFKRLQINTWISAGTSGATNGTKLMPALWVEQREELTAEQAHKYRNTVTFYLNLRRDLLYGFLIGGGVLFLLGLVGVVVSRRRQAAAGAQGADKPLLQPNSGGGDESSVYI